MNLESNYRELLAKQEEGERLRQDVEWLEKFPLKNVVKMNWIPFKKR